jgi:hypothetical protein
LCTDAERVNAVAAATASSNGACGEAHGRIAAACVTVSFVVPMSVLTYTGLAGELVMEIGPIEVSAGSSSSDLRSKATLTVTGKTPTIRGEDRKFFSVATVGP